MSNFTSRERRARKVRRTNRRGAILVMAAVFMLAIVVFAAFMVDLGYITMVSSQLQNSADGAAMAGVEQLVINSNDWSDRQTNAVLAAVAIAKANQPDYGELLSNSDVTLGNWDFDAKTFTATMDETQNAVRAITRRATSNTNQLELFFGRVAGTAAVDVSRTAIAVYAVADVMPMALRDPNFGDVDPDVTAANPGKTGPSSPANGSLFVQGEQVTVFFYGKGSKGPVHLTLDIPADGNNGSPAYSKKVLKGSEPDMLVSTGEQYSVLNGGGGNGGYGEALDDRLNTAYGSAERTIKMPIVKTISGSRDADGKLVGPVQIVDFVLVHLDGIIDIPYVDPKSGQTKTNKALVGTVLEDQNATPTENYNGRLRLVQ